MRTMKYKVAHANRAKKEVTFVEYNDTYKSYWRTYKLPIEEFRYYTRYATENDIKNFLKYGEYRTVNR